MKKLYFFLVLIFLNSNLFAQSVQVTERLLNKMSSLNPLQYTRVLILLKDRVNIEQLDKDLYAINAPIEYRAQVVINTLRDKAKQTQTPILNYLNAEKESGKIKQIINYWITNLIFIEATPDVINLLTKRSDIDVMDLDAELEMDRPFDDYSNAESIETGLKVIKADSLWRLGITGAGRTVMNIDGGVNGTHPALSPRWWGNNGRQWYHSWFDPIAPVSTVPFDCAAGGTYHGTHTMGIMCGRNTATGDTVGVAPDAFWMAAGLTDCPGASYPSMNILAYQWAMDPDTNAATMNMPDVINCSWRDPTATNECTSSIYRTTLTAVEAAGIAVVFSAGNSGPGASTITPPKNINIDSVNVFCVGNVNGNIAGFPISSSSSRGPSLCGGSGTLLIKPEVCAPGTNVRSTWSGSTYSSISGTSMASPHVAGCIALLKQAAPGMTGKQLKAILLSTTTDLGAAGEDNIYGKGLINVYKAYQMLGPIPAASTITFAAEGYFDPLNTRLAIRDSATFYLRNVSPPYSIVDSGKSVVDSISSSGTVTFANAQTGTYYIVVKGRNILETWSRAGGEPYTRGTAFNYNFTTSSSKAYGDNMILRGSRYCIYSGDVIQDFTIVLADVLQIYNDANIFASGFLTNDLTGDRVVDLTDVLLVYNNSTNFVTRKAPPGANPEAIIRTNIEQLRFKNQEIDDDKNYEQKEPIDKKGGSIDKINAY